MFKQITGICVCFKWSFSIYNNNFIFRFNDQGEKTQFDHIIRAWIILKINKKKDSKLTRKLFNQRRRPLCLQRCMTKVKTTCWNLNLSHLAEMLGLHCNYICYFFSKRKFYIQILCLNDGCNSLVAATSQLVPKTEQNDIAIPKSKF